MLVHIHGTRSSRLQPAFDNVYRGAWRLEAETHHPLEGHILKGGTCVVLDVVVTCNPMH